ncbi:MAG TPA: uroporphyrinogen-III synthase [Aquifex aeolicus]|nr:uroporphyrinogen-III synthase [Aquifex aeolicus]
MVKSVLLTRQEEDIERDRKLFERYGFCVVSMPMIRTVPLDFQPPREMDVVVFQSTKAVKYFLEKTSLPEGVKVVAVGEKTQSALEERGIQVNLVPEESSAEGIVRAMPHGKGETVLIPRSREGRMEAVEGLRKKGYRVITLNVYSTEIVIYKPSEVEEALKKVGFVVFASPSAVKGFFANLQKGRAMDMLKDIVVVAIGKTTKKSLTERGVRVGFVPSRPLMEEVVGKIHEIWQRSCT